MISHCTLAAVTPHLLVSIFVVFNAWLKPLTAGCPDALPGRFRAVDVAFQVALVYKVTIICESGLSPAERRIRESQIVLRRR